MRSNQRTRNHRHTRSPHLLSRRNLRSHRFHRLGRRTDPHESRVDDRPCEIRAFREKPVAGMDRVAAGLAGCREEAGNRKVRFTGGCGAYVQGRVRESDVARAAIRVGVHGHGREAGRPAGADHAHGDLAAIRDEHAAEPPELRHGSVTASSRPAPPPRTACASPGRLQGPPVPPPRRVARPGAGSPCSWPP